MKLKMKLKAKQKKKLIQNLKKYAPLPILAVVVIFAVACGKADSSSIGSSSVGAASVAPVSSASMQASPSAKPAPVAFPSWCEENGGMLNHDSSLCEIQLKRMYGNSYNVLWQQWWDTGIQVEPNDTVNVDLAGSPRMKIGNDVTDKSRSGKFIAQSAGHVEFTSRNMSSAFSVRQVTIRRCYAAVGGTPRCP